MYIYYIININGGLVMLKKTYLLTAAFSFLSAITILGCAKHKENAKKIAEINNYNLLEEDFINEAKFYYTPQKIYQNTEKEKEDILHQIIIKKILLQEAQKENLDKDRDFLKEIELYWEQALLKRLMLKKTKEFANKIKITEKELKNLYEKKNTLIRAYITAFNDKSSAIYIKKRGFDKIEDVAGKIISGKEPKWYSYDDDIPKKIRDILFSLNLNTITNPIKIQDSYVIIKVIEKKKRGLPPFKKLKKKLIDELKKEKTEQMFDSWIKQLKKNARVKIYKNNLKKIKIHGGN